MVSLQHDTQFNDLYEFVEFNLRTVYVFTLITLNHKLFSSHKLAQHLLINSK